MADVPPQPSHPHTNPNRPKRPPHRTKKKKSEQREKSVSVHESVKSSALSEAEKIQCQIIDWKRFAVRGLLFLSYCSLAHFIASLFIVSYGYRVIQESKWLMVSLYGFMLNLIVYFLGSGEAILGITYVWSLARFVDGVVTIVLGLAFSIFLYFYGRTTSSADGVTNGHPNELLQDCANKSLRTSKPMGKKEMLRVEKLKKTCPLVDSKLIENTVFYIPFIIPPIAVVCTAFACVCAFMALKFVPGKFKAGEIDAAFVEPYVTYDFYVGRGRNIPKIAGNEEGIEEHSHVVKLYHEGEENSLTKIRGDNQPRMSQASGGGASAPAKVQKIGIPSGGKRKRSKELNYKPAKPMKPMKPIKSNKQEK